MAALVESGPSISLEVLCEGLTSKCVIPFTKNLKNSDIEIKYVVTQPPSSSGRGQRDNLSVVHKWSKLNSYRVFCPKKVGDKKFISIIKNIEVDIIIVVAYGQIINNEILEYPKVMSINVHASLLPRW